MFWHWINWVVGTYYPINYCCPYHNEITQKLTLIAFYAAGWDYLELMDD